MHIHHSKAFTACALALAGMASTMQAQAQTQAQGISDEVVKIGVMTDMASLYSDFSGKGSVEAVKMAVEDFGGKVLGKPIEVLAADHQNKTDVASAKAREWFDSNKVDVIVDLVSSGTALAVNEVGRQKGRVVIVTAAYTSLLTQQQCAPYTIHYQANTTALTSTPRRLVKQGADSWYFVTADYTFGHTMEREASDAIKAGGGKVVGSSRHPLNAADFSSFLLQAQSSGAKFIGLANAGGDTINAIKAANEFGLTRGGKQSLVAMKIYETDINGLSLPVTQGLYTTASFYWDRDAASREWAERFFKRVGKMPTEVHAADYSATTNYLNAVAAAGSDDAKAVVEKLRATPVNDFFARNGKVRADGMLVKDLYVVQVKKPAESKRAWDLFNVVATIPGDEAFAPLQGSRCPLVKP
jgi:branched-chain amino acid transport system substrate-binding protein